MTKTERNIYIFAILLVFASVFSCIAVMPGLVEQGLLLYRAKMWLSGKELYRDIFTVNMPLIFCIDAIPATLAMHVGIFKDYQYLYGLGFVLLAYVIYLALRIIRQHPALVRDKKKLWEFGLLLLTVFIAFQNPIYCFDREYLFLILTLPYLLRFMPSLAALPAPLSLRVTVGIMAGIGFCIKPHCLLLFIGINLAGLVCNRTIAMLKSTENITIYLSGAAYLLSVWIGTPDYVHVVLPMALATYSAASRSINGLIFFALALFVFIPPLVDFRLRYTSPYRKDIFYLFIIAPFLVLYGVSNNGWGYGWTPLANLGSILVLFLLWEYEYLKNENENKGQPGKPFQSGINGCLISFSYSAVLALVNFFAAILVFISMPDSILGAQFRKDIEVANHNQPVTSFGAISMDFDLWPHMAKELGAEWDTRFDHLWMLPKLLASDENFRQKNAWIRAYVSQAFAEDLEHNKPEIVFIDDTDYFYNYRHYVDLAAYFSASPEFARAWSHYRYAAKINKLPDTAFKTTHHGYYVYQRINTP